MTVTASRPRKPKIRDLYPNKVLSAVLGVTSRNGKNRTLRKFGGGR